MSILNVLLMGSGKGTLIDAVCNAQVCDILKIKIVNIITNNKENNSSIRGIADKYSIPYVNLPWDDSVSREDYDNELINIVQKTRVDLVVLAGWMHVMSDNFINTFKNIINIHPSLPGKFTGTHCIKRAFDAYQRGEITHTGSMVHRITPEVDVGEVIATIDVPIYPNDTYELLENRQKSFERGLLIQSIQKFVTKHNSALVLDDDKPYVGKVRTVKDVGYGMLLLTASDRLSAFDKHMCNIENKGTVLNSMSAWWFEQTRNIIDNHYLYSNSKYMIVKKANPIKLEFIVRGYMTGSTNTSIWPMYKNGNRKMYGIEFRDGYKKNEKLDDIILTPTTKGVTDKPITEEEIIAENYLTPDEYAFIKQKSLELFKYGQKIADEKGLILVDTKYEFGYYNDEIILIDELHTCDSSRYWLKDTYVERLQQSMEPNKKDKDVIRDWVKKNCDPYNDVIPQIPENLIKQVENIYDEYLNIFVTKDSLDTLVKHNDEASFLNYYLKNKIDKMVVIISGSVSDQAHNLKIQKCLTDQGLYSEIYNCSAHKDTRGVLDILSKYEGMSRKICYVTVAGMSNALSGVVSCNTRFPVIGCPPFKDLTDMMVNINSTIQCPSNVPVMTMLSPKNVALAIRKIFNL